MRTRQTMPERWLIVARRNERGIVSAARRLRPGSGILLLQPLHPRDMLRLRLLARRRGLVMVVEEKGAAARVHNLPELRRALLSRTPLVLLSPIHHTRTHPDWAPIPKMRAAAFARLARRRLLALGGMDEKRYAWVARLGFIGWAGISAFRT